MFQKKQTKHRVLLAWLNRQLAERKVKACGRVLQKVVERDNEGVDA